MLHFGRTVDRMGAHDGVNILAIEGRSCKRIFDGLHDGAVEGLPGIVFGHAFGADGVSPRFGFLNQPISFIGHLTIGSGPDAKCFTGFVWLLAFGLVSISEE